jgi:hypothetical protein
MRSRGASVEKFPLLFCLLTDNSTRPGFGIGATGKFNCGAKRDVTSYSLVHVYPHFGRNVLHVQGRSISLLLPFCTSRTSLLNEPHFYDYTASHLTLTAVGSSDPNCSALDMVTRC